MKRFIAFALIALLMVCAFTFVVSAEETPVAEDVPTVEAPVVEETPTVEEPPVEDPTVTESIVDYVKAHIEEISVIITLILTIFYNVRKHGVLNQSIGTLNNNAINVAENSALAISNALTEISRLSKEVTDYRAVIDNLLAEFRASAEEKDALANVLTNVKHFLETAKLANVELADEVAELLVLANIPNSKKDELYARHLAAVNAIAEAEKTEVINHDGEEA